MTSAGPESIVLTHEDLIELGITRLSDLNSPPHPPSAMRPKLSLRRRPGRREALFGNAEGLLTCTSLQKPNLTGGTAP